MLAMYESEFSPRLYFGGVEHPLCVGLKSPVLFLLESGFRHVLARRQADAGQVRIRQEHLPDTLAEVVDRGLVVDIVRNAVFSFGSVNEHHPAPHRDSRGPLQAKEKDGDSTAKYNCNGIEPGYRCSPSKSQSSTSRLYCFARRHRHRYNSECERPAEC